MLNSIQSNDQVSVASKETPTVGDEYFGGSFTRSGHDLILHDGAEQLVISEYFSTDTPPALTAPNGALLTGETVTLLAGPAFPGQYAQAGATLAPNAIGTVQKLEGSASAQRADGSTVELKINDSVFKGDVLNTSDGSTLGLMFSDGTAFVLQGGTRMVLNEFIFNPASTSNSALFSFVQGTFSMVAGKLAPTGDFKVATPIATMGIRGTSVLGVQVNVPGGRLSLTTDPSGGVGAISVIDNVTGVLYTVLETIFSKIVLTPNGLVLLLPKSIDEVTADQGFTQLLHDVFGTLQVPQAGPDQIIPQHGPNRFPPPPVIKIDFNAGTLPTLKDLLLQTGLDLSTLTSSQTTNQLLEEGEEPTGPSVTITDLTPSVEGGDATVDEAGLADGSDTSATTENANGTFAFTAPDGLAGVTINGVLVVDSNGDLTHNPVTTSLGVLLVTGFDAATGQVTYAYTLTDNTLHSGSGVDSVFDNLTILVTDINGDSATATLSIEIKDDVPTAKDDTDEVTEDSGVAAAGNVITDAEANGDDGADVPGADGIASIAWDNESEGTVEGQYGTLTLSAFGNYAYVLDNTNEQVDGLSSDDPPLTDTFTYTITDGDGDTSIATLTITIFGTNDAPVANADTNWAQEDSADASGNVLVTLAHSGSPSGLFTDVADTDVDLETLTVTNIQDTDGNLAVTAGTTSANGTVIAGLYGTLTIGANGSYSYILTDALAAVQGLDAGETLTDEVFTYTVSDGTTTDTATLTITIFGTNDAPVANADTNWAQEDSADASGNVLVTLAHSGSPSGLFTDVADTDVDLETLTVTNIQDTDGNLAVTAGTTSANGTVIAGLYGTLTIGANGSYSYILTDALAAVQGLDAGETLTDEVFTYTVSDGTTTDTATLTITIFGTNDAPVANADTNWAQEDSADASGNVLVTLAHSGSPSGLFTDVADTDVDLETLTVTNIQDTDGNLAVTAGTTSANGTVIAGLYGTLTIGANGSYSYILTDALAAVQGLDAGETLTDEVFTYTVSDGTTTDTATLTITIFGTNDAPVANADTNWAQEDSADASGNVLVTLAHSGSPSGLFTDVADTDVDLETLTVTNIQDTDGNLAVTAGTTSANGTVIAGLYGTLTIGANGSYSYILTDALAAVQGLDAGETLTDEVFTYTVSDGTTTDTATLTITIFGTNDAPVANADTNWAQEDSADASGNVLVTLAHSGSPSGLFTDVADTDVDLETLTVTNIQDTDGNLAVTAGTTSANGTVIAGLYGTLTIGANGSYSYILTDALAAVQGLDAGETLTDEVFTYTVSDGTTTDTATLTITIFGTNDAPVANADTNWAQEDSADASGNVLVTLAHSGSPSGLFTDVADTDVDLETLTVTNIQDTDGNLAVTAGTTSANGTVIAGLYGTLTIGANGSYSYILTDALAAVQGLDAGETLTDEVFTYTVSDGTTTDTATLTITIFGTNDAPVANADTNWAQEDSADASGNVLVTLAHSGSPSGLFTDVADTDVDLETLTVTNIQDTDGNLAVTAGTTSANGTVIAGLYGTLTIGANGSYSYILTDALAAVQGLDAGETLTDEVFTYTVSDGTTTDTATLTITIFGTNDGPNLAPTVNAPSSITYLSAANSSGDKTGSINRLSFQDGNGNVLITVTLAVSSVGDTLTAFNPEAYNVSVLNNSNGTGTLVLQGTVSNINAYLTFGQNVVWDPNSPEGSTKNFNDSTLTVTVSDGSLTDQTTVNLIGVDALPNGLFGSGQNSSSSTDFSSWNMFEITGQPDGSVGSDSMVTTWSHEAQIVDQATTPVSYIGGDESDSITLVFTSDQLAQILADHPSSTWQTELRAYLANPVGDVLELGGTDWNAQAREFETAHISMSNGYGTGIVDMDAYLNPLPALFLGTTGDLDDNLLIASAGGQTLSGAGGDDVLVANNLGSTLNGGLGNDLLIGRDGVDTLDGNEGKNVLAGGSGGDTFKITSLDIADVILDYGFSEGDEIDLTGLLYAVYGTGNGSMNNVQLTHSGSDVNVQIDTDTGGGTAYQTVAVLSGYNTNSADPVAITIDNVTVTTSDAVG